MPRGRGGKRQGASGKSYSNRQDLTQAPTAAPNQEYGQAAAQKRAQAMAPLPQQAPPPPAGGGAPAAPLPAAGGAPTVAPGGLGALDAMSDRPNEPLTAGLATGPGPGPEALNMPLPVVDPTIHVLQGILAAYPNPDIQALLDVAQNPR